jgi:SAM-dependent methyltransferase
VTAPAANDGAAGFGGPGAWLFTFAVFFSAALLFAVQPMAGKLFLPLMGGSAAAWNASLTFFQGALLLGYLYAHLLQRIASLRAQAAAHLAVLALAGLSLPLGVTRLLGEPWAQAPMAWLVAAMALTLGAPFAALSATAPLLQAWLARGGGATAGGRDVYRLYAASNLGSLLALIAYPLLIEPLVGVRAQTGAWGAAYGGFVLTMLAVGALCWRYAALPQAAAGQAAGEVSWRERTAWVLLAAAPSSLLLGVTAHITADVASAPLFWVVPLVLYLATFIYAFGRGVAPEGWALKLQIAAVAAALMSLGPMTWILQLPVHLLAFFVSALVCHQALVARRPPEARLTEFYLLVALGGVLGGAFNAFAAPVLFHEVWEYPLVLALACLARPGGGRLEPHQKGWLAAGMLWLIPLFIPGWTLPTWGASALMLTPAVVAAMLWRKPLAVTLLFLALGAAAMARATRGYDDNRRSYFGVLHMKEDSIPVIGPVRTMTHGTTLHGVQALSPAQRCRPMSYYAPEGLIGRVFATEQARRPRMNVAVAGLGAGSTATFVRPGDRMRFFEIDPLVVKTSFDPKVFSFVSDCARGPVDVVLGDARLKLAHEPAGSFDLVLADAFSSDAVPAHLLTAEAIAGYLRAAKPDGLVLLHLSNRNLRLAEPAAAAVRKAGGYALYGEFNPAADVHPYAVAGHEVMIVARSPRVLDAYRGRPGWGEAPGGGRAWTDDYTNVVGAALAKMHWF